MKTRINLTLTLLLGIITLFITSCDKEKCPTANGQMVSEVRKVEPFTKIELLGSGEVFLYQVSDEDEESVEVEASSNIMDRIETTVRNGRLEIDTKCINGHGKMIFNIRVRNLSMVHISGSAEVYTVTPFTSDYMDLQITGSGNMDFKVTAKELHTGISGSGDVDLQGQVDILDISIDGSGDIHAFELPTTDCYINISGSGNSEVTVNGLLDVIISGSGNVVYDGSPTKFNINTSGSGVVRKR